MAINDLKWWSDHHIIDDCDRHWKLRFQGFSNFLFGDVSKLSSNWSYRRLTDDTLRKFHGVAFSENGNVHEFTYVNHVSNLEDGVLIVRFEYILEEPLPIGERLIRFTLYDNYKVMAWYAIDVTVTEFTAVITLKINLKVRWA